MDEQELLLLGLLKVQSQHTYQLNDFIERNLSHLTEMKKPTAYAVLERLSKAGYVDARSEQEGKRPPRKVYSITPAGEALYQQLLRENLAQSDHMRFAGNVGLMFLDDLPASEAIALLSQRLQDLERLITVHEQAPRHEHGLGVDLALEHVLVHLRADRAWLQGTLERLEKMAPTP